MVDETVENTPAEDAPETTAATDTETATTEATEAETTEAAEAEAATDTETATSDSAAAELTLGQEPAAEEVLIGTAFAPMIRGKVDRFGVAIGTGRRKTSVARVRIKDGDGKLTINGRTLEDFFKVERDRQLVMAPLEATDSVGKVDVWIRVNGGGTTGQAGAIVLGIARTLEARDPDLHTILSSGGYLTRDSRMVERKKYGLRKARRSFQFSKR